MKSLNFPTISTIGLLAVALGLPLAAAPAGHRVGDRMPQTGIRSQTLHGGLRSIDNYQGDSGTLVIFAGACAESSVAQAQAVELARLYKPQGVVTVLVNSNDPATHVGEGPDGIGMQPGLSLPYLIDERAEIARAYGASHVSEAFLFDANGQLVYRGAVGDGDSVAKGFLAEALEAIVTRREVVMDETPASGCEISFRE